MSCVCLHSHPCPLKQSWILSEYLSFTHLLFYFSRFFSPVSLLSNSHYDLPVLPACLLWYPEPWWSFKKSSHRTIMHIRSIWLLKDGKTYEMFLMSLLVGPSHRPAAAPLFSSSSVSAGVSNTCHPIPHKYQLGSIVITTIGVYLSSHPTACSEYNILVVL